MKTWTKDRIGKILLLIWIPLISIVISFQMVNHILSMPLPEDYQKIHRNIPRLRQSQGWLMVHVIYEQCSCTQALTKSLMTRGARPDLEEWVVFAGSDAQTQRRFEAQGYAFHPETRDTIGERYGIEAAPMLLIFSPDDTLAYAGGYFERPSVFRSMDQSLLSRIQNHEPVEALPLYGCALSSRLQNLIDPFGVKL